MSTRALFIQLHSMHGLIRGRSPELGRDADTGGQVLYVLELAKALGRHPQVARVELVTRLIEDDEVGPDYAVEEEPLGGNAFLVRVRAGGPRYIRKEDLWPHLEAYTEAVASRIEATGRVPDVFHSHYADAGAVVTRLSRRFGKPQVHTGHSLGRAKRRQLLATGADPREIEASYQLTRRIHEEEATFAHAVAIVASTHQERRAQYGEYQADTAGKVYVIPPGIDLARFYPYNEGMDAEADARLRAGLERFLDDPDKPLVLAVSRPVRKKNLQALVRAFGEDAELRRMANLVVFAGQRDDIRALAPNERQVLTELLVLADRHDLYGSLALPKRHEPTDIPEIYRLAARSRGVFVNPALTEPFGLTLLEAAASGLPIVATDDGGPPDIVGACRNGLLVPPTDTAAIAKSIKAILTSPMRWLSMSRSGVEGVRRQYTWEAHVSAYMEVIRPLTVGLEEAESPVAKPATGPLGRRLVPRLVVTDIDDTLVGDPMATRRLAAWLAAQEGRVGFVLATGRTMASVRPLLEAGVLPMPDAIFAAVGTDIRYGPEWGRDAGWEARMREGWDAGLVRQVLDGFPELLPQEATAQSRYKVSYYANTEAADALLAMVHERLGAVGLACKLVFSNENLLDVLPAGAGKGQALAYFCARWGYGPDDVLACGDSLNDEDMLVSPYYGVVPREHRETLDAFIGRPRLHFASASFADAILEGVEHHQLLAGLRSPGDS